eukprot:CAMPEP_0118932294 /NCGR_PEP_ID=MMETSP1169-20130426/9769_1 /TAXON_ID=36882 /ORGANISM="Pyramimonas obovata, Strain CCMP722" /LENGTH=143 /DNA_ID=CAMNT_0006874931 /DNA_START=53 /DNA_END=484 /DNA_ORIENTATION=+
MSLRAGARPIAARNLSARAPVPSALRAPAPARSMRAARLQVSAYTVTITTLEGKKHQVEVGEDENLLDAALDAGIDVTHDCKMGVCMTCPAKLTAGRVDQGTGMLSEDTIELGYALMCVATPQSDCEVTLIDEDELLEQQLSA